MKLTTLVKSLAIATALFSPVTMAETTTVSPHLETQENQVAGYFRLALDPNTTITALYDGPVNLPTKWLRGIDAKEANAIFEQFFMPLTADGVQTSVNAYLVKQGEQFTLIDAGAAKCFGDDLGNIIKNLNASGVKAEQINNVFVTHLHPDHACGVTTVEGEMAFPNATLYAPQEDAEYWLGEKITHSESEHDQVYFKAARATVAPYQKANRFNTFKKGENPVAGIETLDEFGHSPGMSGYLVGSGDKRLLVWGDIIHSHSIQLKNPNISVEVDTDQEKAIATRKRILTLVEEGKLLVAAAHLPFPGIGHIIKEGEGYRWLPVEFLPLK
ncbi:MBL fold metallo-hydrolase [Rodentibacter myodis]|uniref:MBL fold metallo-hydrolase n=1 Tax=Rodentibacter myodis TaxID=1907939 RepID=A0A1V3JJM2_9PAST|nr:MBL fold metallo-hydrolase [Rodentibacter myodis]OOF56956.1 MBL fold metallo-hydrolase [Rodentibacter myodis]